MNSVLIQFLCIIFFFSICGCKKNEYLPTETVTVVLTENPKSLDPRFTTDATGQRLNHLIFNSLVRVGKDMQIVGDAAKSWSYKNLTYEFVLHKGLAFSNGRSLSEKDIDFTFSEFTKASSPFHSAFRVIEKVTSDFTSENPIIRIKLNKFSASFLLDLTVIRLLSYKDSDQLIGTGVFEMVSKNLNEIILRARPYHPIHKPNIKYVVFKIMKDDATRFLNVYKGSLDIIQMGIPLNKIEYIKNRKKYQIYTHPGPSMNYILLNLRRTPFNDKIFRQKLATSIDRESLIKFKLEGFAEPATSLLPTNNFFHYKKLLPIAFNQSENKNYFKKFENNEFTLKTSNNPEVIEVAKVIASQLGEAGLKIKIQSFEWGTFYGDINSGNYEMAMMRWVGLSDPDIYRTAFHSRELPPGRNRSFYINKNLDNLLDEGIAIEDTKKRIDHYNVVQKIIYDEMVIIPLWYNTLVDVVHNRIENYVPPSNGDLSPLYSIKISSDR